jgi:hypothetical protein
LPIPAAAALVLVGLAAAAGQDSSETPRLDLGAAALRRRAEAFNGARHHPRALDDLDRAIRLAHRN